MDGNFPAEMSKLRQGNILGAKYFYKLVSLLTDKMIFLPYDNTLEFNENVMLKKNCVDTIKNL